MALIYKISYCYTDDCNEHYMNFGSSKQAAMANANKLLNSADLSELFVFSYDENDSNDFSDIVYFESDGSITNCSNWAKKLCSV